MNWGLREMLKHGVQLRFKLSLLCFEVLVKISQKFVQLVLDGVMVCIHLVLELLEVVLDFF